LSILDALKRSDPDNAEIDAALQGERDAEKQKGDLYQKGEKVAARLAAMRRENAAAAFEAETTGDETRYQNLKAGIAKLEEEASRIEAAMATADEKLLDAQRRRYRAGKATYLRTVKRLTTKRAKHLAELQAAIARVPQ
jgi:hypothetical protein